MLSRLKKRATFANICAFLALMIAVTAGTAYANNTVRSKDIVDGQVKTQDLGGSAVTSGKVKDATLSLSDLAADSVDTSKIKDGSIVQADMSNDSIGSNQLQTDSVNATEIADNSIDGGEIVNDSLGASDLAPGSVGTSEVIDGSLTGTDIASNSITTADLAGTDASGAISLGTGAVANGRCNFYDISVPGALADQTVIISARATLPTGQILYGVEVPQNDHVIMAACNFSGGTWDSLANFPIRTVTFG
jgi:hypothetical protein